MPAQGGFYGMSGGGVAGHGAGMSYAGLFADGNEYNQQGAGGAEGVARGTALIIAHNSSTEFKLKYPLINHVYSSSVE